MNLRVSIVFHRCAVWGLGIEPQRSMKGDAVRPQEEDIAQRTEPSKASDWWGELKYAFLASWLVLVACGLEATHAILTLQLLRACPLATTVTCLELFVGAILGAIIVQDDEPRGDGSVFSSAVALALWSLTRAFMADPRGFPMPTQLDFVGVARLADETLREARIAVVHKIKDREPPVTHLGVAPANALATIDRVPPHIVAAAMAAFEPVGALAIADRSSAASTCITLAAAAFWAQRARAGLESWPALAVGATLVGAAGSTWTSAFLRKRLLWLPLLAGLLLLPYALAIDLPLPRGLMPQPWPPLLAMLILAAAAAHLKRLLKLRLSLIITSPHLAVFAHVLCTSSSALALEVFHW